MIQTEWKCTAWLWIYWEGMERNRSVIKYLSLSFSPLALISSEEGGTSSVAGLSGCSCVAFQLLQQFRAICLCSAPLPDPTVTLSCFLAGKPHFDKCTRIISFHPSFACVLQEEGKPGPQPSCSSHEDWRAQLSGTLLFQQNRTSQCCWLLCYIFPDRALVIKIVAITHMDSCNCKRHSKSKGRIHSLTQIYPQSVRMWHIGNVSVPNYECHYLLFFWMLFMIVTFIVN